MKIFHIICHNRVSYGELQLVSAFLLQVRKAMPITLKSDVMKLELKSATMSEYRKENIGLILHQVAYHLLGSICHFN